MNSKLRIIVTGLLAQYPLGGVTWDYLQYVTGLARLGHDVTYIEDTGQWPYVPGEGGLVKDCQWNVDFLAALMKRFGLEDRWAYRFPWKSQWFGLSDERREEVIRECDLLINVSGTLERPEEYRSAKRMAYIDSDPVFTQVKLVKGYDHFRKLIEAHDILFSFGEAQGEATPDSGHHWLPTRQPMVLSEWRPGKSDRGVYTTVMNWNAYKPIVHEGRTFGQKDLEFPKFIDLPSRVEPAKIQLAANPGKGSKLPVQRLRKAGWDVVHPNEVCGDLDSYREFIETSKGEWSVAKNGYVEGQSGWFSCRSSCYLAAGRPVVVQETGFSKVIPTGEGLFAFQTLEEAAEGINTIESDYEHHAQAARSLAEEYFDSDRVLADLIDRAMNPGASNHEA